MSGHLVLCWGAVDRGCRQMVVHHTEKGWYDWASGAFKVAYRGKRPVCGALDACIGDRGEWTGQIVATPSRTSPNPPPCLGNPGDTCTPATTCLP